MVKLATIAGAAAVAVAATETAGAGIYMSHPMGAPFGAPTYHGYTAAPHRNRRSELTLKRQAQQEAAALNQAIREQQMQEDVARFFEQRARHQEEVACREEAERSFLLRQQEQLLAQQRRNARAAPRQQKRLALKQKAPKDLSQKLDAKADKLAAEAHGKKMAAVHQELKMAAVHQELKAQNSLYHRSGAAKAVPSVSTAVSGAAKAVGQTYRENVHEPVAKHVYQPYVAPAAVATKKAVKCAGDHCSKAYAATDKKLRGAYKSAKQTTVAAAKATYSALPTKKQVAKAAAVGAGAAAAAYGAASVAGAHASNDIPGVATTDRCARIQAAYDETFPASREVPVTFIPSPTGATAHPRYEGQMVLPPTLSATDKIVDASGLCQLHNMNKGAVEELTKVPVYTQKAQEALVEKVGEMGDDLRNMKIQGELELEGLKTNLADAKQYAAEKVNQGTELAQQGAAEVQRVSGETYAEIKKQAGATVKKVAEASSNAATHATNMGCKATGIKGETCTKARKQVKKWVKAAKSA